MENEKITFTTLNKDGEEVECEVLFTVESDETGKIYIAYTDNCIDENGNTIVYASIYDSSDDNAKLLPIKTDEEWKIIESILENLQDDTYTLDEDDLFK